MTNHPNRSGARPSQPLLDKAYEIADKAGIKVLNGPPGGHGFRNGYWTVERNGEIIKVYASVPHDLDLSMQHDWVKSSASIAFAIRDLQRQGFDENKQRHSAGVSAPSEHSQERPAMHLDFDDMASRFTSRMSSAANWKQSYFGAAYSTRIREAISEAKQAIAEAEAHPEIGFVDADKMRD